MDVEVAELLEVCPIKVEGQFEMSHFTPGARYEILFLMMMKYPFDSEIEPHVTMTIEVPDGTKQEKELSLKAMVPSQWAEVKAGEFVATEEDGDVKFSLSTNEKAEWEKGLVIEGVLIEPCTQKQ